MNLVAYLTLPQCSVHSLQGSAEVISWMQTGNVIFQVSVSFKINLLLRLEMLRAMVGYVGGIHIVYIPCSMNDGARLQLVLGLGTFL